MMRRLLAAFVLSAGLLSGSAALAQLTFRYSVTGLEPAGENTYKLTLETSALGASSSPPASLPNANPVTLLWRRHNATDDAAAWNGSLLTPVRGWEQVSAAETGRDPKRWSRVDAVTLTDDPTDSDELIDALRGGLATYEWYVSAAGLGGSSQISDIQDHGRKQNFDDATLWTGTAADDRKPADVAALGGARSVSLKSMGSAPGGVTWEIRNGSVGTNGASGGGALGAQLLNVVDLGDNYATAAQIVSPYYPDGVSAVVFEAAATRTDDLGVPLLFQYRTQGATDWTTLPLTAENTAVATTDGASVAFQPGAAVQGSVILSDAFLRYTVSLPPTALPVNSGARFRIVRAAYQPIASEYEYETTCVIRNLRVRSAAPSATLAAAPTFSVSGAATGSEPSGLDDFTVSFALSGISSDPAPTGYTGRLTVARRGDDLTAQPTTLDMDVTSSAGVTRLSTTFLARELSYNDADNRPNVESGAFFTQSGRTVGLLPNVYDLSVALGVRGSYLAGRTALNERETVTTVYDAIPAADGDTAAPFILEVRENRTKQRAVDLMVSVLDETGSHDLISTLAFACEPVSEEGASDTWRVLLPKELPEETYAGYSYAWGTNRTVTDSSGSYQTVNPDTLDSSVIAVKVRVTTVEADGSFSYSWYGAEAAAEGAATPPESVTLAQAVRKDLTKGTTNGGDDVKAFGIDAASVTHPTVLAEIDLSANGVITLTSAAEQDFNTWVATSDDFSESSYSDSMVYARTNFDARTGLDADSGRYEVLGGWYPDEGPFAGENALEDDFAVGRAGLGENGSATGGTVGADAALYYPGTATDANNLFASWGASHAPGQPYLLIRDANDYDTRTENMALGPGAELLLSRGTAMDSQTRWLPDALVRLRSNTEMGPNYAADSLVTLNGIGQVTFTMALSIPYDIQGRVGLYPLDAGDNFMSVARGVQSRIRFTTLPASSLPGYSVSLYLASQSGRTVSGIYEARFTQISDFSTRDGQRPGNQVICELYRWNSSGDAYAATRLPVSGTGTVSSQYFATAGSLSGATVAFWVGADGKLRVGFRSNTAESVSNANFTSADKIFTNPGTANLSVALGSAECLPVFDAVSYTTAPKDGGLTGDDWKGFTGNTWLIGNEAAWNPSAQSTSLSVTRRTPSTDTAGAVLIEAVDNGLVINRKRETAGMTPKTVSVVLGNTGAQLRIRPDGKSNVLIDSVRVTSWCGDDRLRNGSYVPTYTDPGFPGVAEGNTGFAAVGAWITPKYTAELNGSQAGYSGDQVMLLQYSRRNESCGTEGVLNGVRTTNNGLAVYMPYTNNGIGAVNLRYMIPATNPATGLPNPDVEVLLQYTSSSSYVKDFLGTPGGPFGANAWQPASQVKRLSATDGEWRSAAIVPDPNLLPENFSNGYIRLVMVTTNRGETDPMVYLDQIFLTQKAAASSAVWYGTNTKLTSTPADDLYWKDREPNSSQSRDTPFAERSRLTAAMQFNDVSQADGTDSAGDTAVSDTFAMTALDSPYMDKGIGQVTFAARRLEPGASVRVYVAVSLDGENVPRNERIYRVVHSVDVRGEIWQPFSLDLAGISAWPDDGSTFDCTQACWLRLMVGQEDNPDAVPGNEDAQNRTGRILVDRVVVSDPVVPTVDAASIVFANGDNDFAGRTSPLSQPVHGAPEVRVRVTLEPYDADRIDSDSVRVFLSCILSTPGAADGRLAAVTDGNVSYTDVLGNDVSGSADAPIYVWNDLANWPVSKWLTPNLPSGEVSADPAAVAAVVPGALTIELTRSGDGSSVYEGTLPDEIATADVNSLVRYAAWFSYVVTDDAGEGDGTGTRRTMAMTATSYREFPWYFPRSLNEENRSRYEAASGAESAGAAYFSPYYWVYETVPGEVFVNEFNLNDGTQIPTDTKEHVFVEVCAPAETSLGGWRLGLTVNTSTTLDTLNPIPTLTDPEGGKLPTPDADAVPAARNPAIASDRAFHTLFASRPSFYQTVTAGGGETSALVGSAKNAGIGSEMGSFSPSNRISVANSILLYRPTGGAEHILVYSNGDASGNAATMQGEVTRVMGYYKAGYSGHGFDFDDATGAWSQTFASGDWAKKLESETNPDATLTILKAKSDGSRLVSVLVKPDATNIDEANNANFMFDFAGGDDASSTANSFSTIDMGTVWVQTDNAVSAKATAGPTDLSDLFQTTWPGYNPTERARSGDDTHTIMVTPRQINVNQYLIPYEGIRQISVTSNIAGLGSHLLSVTSTNTTRYGGLSAATWSVPETAYDLELTYRPVVYQKLTGLTVSFVDRVSRETVTDEATVRTLLADALGAGFGIASFNAGLVTLTIPDAAFQDDGSVTVPFDVFITDGGTTTYNPTFTATFTLDPETVGGGITSVRTYCGDGAELPGYAKYQPWWGSAFGFEVTYDTAEDLPAAAQPRGVLVVYPDGAHRPGTGNWDTASDAYAWAGLNVMTGMPLDQALAWLNSTSVEDAAAGTIDGGVTLGARFARIDGAADGRIASANVVPILGREYEASAPTVAPAEPPVPYIVWGIYTDSAANDRGGMDEVTFVLPQKLGADSTVFTKPDWYRGPDYAVESAGVPYFHLYSTPPQSAWVSELDLDGTAGAAAPVTGQSFVEVAMPKLRKALTEAGVPQTDPTAWSVAFCGADGVADATVSLPETGTDSGIPSYGYHVVTPLSGSVDFAAPTAAVLIRPAGIAEGGVWTQRSDAVSPGTRVEIPDAAKSTWLAPAADEVGADGATVIGTYIYPGVADGPEGSVQLVGRLVPVSVTDQITAYYLSSDASLRYEWAYQTVVTPGADNSENGSTVTPEPPAWNQVTLVSRMRNAATGFEASECGYWTEGLFLSASAGNPGSQVFRQTREGANWIYGNGAFSLSYRNRSGYVFGSIALPPDMVGRVMLFGGTSRIVERADLERRITEYRNLAAVNPDAKETAWLNLGGLCDVDADRGVITFKPDTVFDKTDGTTFADLENYYVTLVIVEEPISAVSEITVSMNRGNVVPGLWLYTQSFFGWEAENDPDPDMAKGGTAFYKPIWTDADGNADGEYKDVHGWVYQPRVGDTLGMTAVIVPEEGLTANASLTAAQLRERLTALSTETSVRPFLVWNLIPASRVNTDTGSDAAADFFSTWNTDSWLGRDPRAMLLTDLRRNLGNVTGSLNGTFTRAGVVPMIYDRGTADNPKTDPVTSRDALFFRTMTPDEFSAAADASAATGISLTSDDTLAPFVQSIVMKNDAESRDWTDGAVLRFAIVVADARTGTIYDWQSVSNFTSDNMPAYCPWYLPAETADLNTISRSRGRGESPYVWVYEVPQGVAWINEFRPFRGADDNAVPAFELAMYRSAVSVDTTADSTRYLPEWSLDGWELVMQKAPLPRLKTPYISGQSFDVSTAELVSEVEWEDVGSVELRGWIPSQRLGHNPDDSAYADGGDRWGGLDFYPITSDAARLNKGQTPAWIAYDGTVGPAGTTDRFNYLRISESAFPYQAPEGTYADGVIYALSLRRNNGVVEDRVLFYSEKVEDQPAALTHWGSRMKVALAAENRRLTSAGLVRGLTDREVEVNGGGATAQFLRYSETGSAPYELYWAYDRMGNQISTLPGPNAIDLGTGDVGAQPNSSYEPSANQSRYYTLGAQLQGAAADLLMTLNGAKSSAGANGMVLGSALSGSAYTLSVTGWNSNWFRFGGATRNGESVSVTPAKTYVSGGLNTLAETDSLTFGGTLEGDTEYVISFLYTDAARRLADSGVLDGSADDGFLAWLMQAAPDAVIAAQGDGVTAAEKYWVGLSSAAVDASDVELSVRSVAFDTEASTDGSAALSTFAFSFTKGGEPIETLRGDGRLVLLGKAELDGPWSYVTTLSPDDIARERYYVIDTDLRFFKAVLISARDTDALK